MKILYYLFRIGYIVQWIQEHIARRTTVPSRQNVVYYKCIYTQEIKAMSINTVPRLYIYIYIYIYLYIYIYIYIYIYVMTKIATFRSKVEALTMGWEIVVWRWIYRDKCLTDNCSSGTNLHKISYQGLPYRIIFSNELPFSVQFHRLFLNWCWHSRKATTKPWTTWGTTCGLFRHTLFLQILLRLKWRKFDLHGLK